MNFREKMFIFLLVFISIAALIFWVGKIYVSATKQIPEYGGSYTEGMIGQPNYINPILAQNNEVDASIASLIYSGLLRGDRDGNLVNDLAENYDVSEDGKEYVFHIKRGAKWQDGEELNVDDIIFTINILNDPAYKSPLRQNWQGVSVEKVSDYDLKFVLEKPYFGFLENLTLGILPEHIWKNTPADKFHLVKYNLEPIGTGPYKFSNYHKDSEGNILDYETDAFENYFGGKPYINNIDFSFYSNEEDLINSYNRKEISGISNVSAQNGNLDNFKKNTSLYELKIPWSFSVFFNINKSVPLANKDVRRALNWAINKEQIINEALLGKALAIDSPFFPDTDEYNNSLEKFNFDLQKANEILDQANWKLGEDGIRIKDDVRLTFKLLNVDTPDLVRTAEIIKEQWTKVGAEVIIESLSFSDIKQNYIRPREYDALLVGQDSSFNVDPYSFWHSSQKKDPGLNLALFDNSTADELIEKARGEVDRTERAKEYFKFQEIIKDQVPAVFLFSPYYLYLVDSKIKGIELDKINSSQFRFSNINNWYIKTKRVKK